MGGNAKDKRKDAADGNNVKTQQKAGCNPVFAEGKQRKYSTEQIYLFCDLILER